MRSSGREEIVSEEGISKECRSVEVTLRLGV